MTRVIIWKEFREQGLIAGTLLVLGVALLIAVATLTDPATASAGSVGVFQYLGVGRLATLLLAVTAGMVCGGSLFAGEREAGTMPFLDSLPASRWELWWAKLAAGFALAALQIAVVVAAAVMLGLVTRLQWAIELLLYALQAFAWGSYGSTVARTTLGSVGVAITAASLTAFILLLPIMAIFPSPGTNLPRSTGQVVFVGMMLLTPIVLSLLAFTRPDRDRAADDPTAGVGFVALSAGGAGANLILPLAHRAVRPRFGLRALFWLSMRQLRLPAAVISAFALLFGFSLLLPGIDALLCWLPLTLTAGIVAGVTAFADEQSHGSAHYWGERRLPLGRAWAVKVFVHALFALWLVLLLAVPSVIRAQSDQDTFPTQTLLAAVFHSLLFDHLNVQGWKVVFLPVVYGFAAGHLCGLLFRKIVVAMGVAGLVGGTLAAMWMPSLLAGGMMHWQVWLPPIMAMCTARVLVRSWGADRMTYRRPLKTLAVGLVIVILVQAAGIGFRVVGVPDNPAGEDDIRYVGTLPPFDENATGRDFRTAAERYIRISMAVSSTQEQKGPSGLVRRPVRHEDMASAMLQPGTGQGWRGDNQQLVNWLNQVYELDRPLSPEDRTWYTLATDAADPRHPTGMFVDPRLISSTSKDIAPDNARRMAIALLVRGLQRQASGEPEAFVHNLRIALVLSRSLRMGSVISAYETGHEIARNAAFGTDHWLEALTDRPDLVEKALQHLMEGDPTEPFNPDPHFLAERFVLRETMKAPSQWLPEQITAPGKDKELTNPEVDMVSFAWTVPWERERTRRLVGLGQEFEIRFAQRPLSGRPGRVAFIAVRKTRNELIEMERQLRLFRRVAALRLAVRLYQLRKGTTPVTLQDIVAVGYLSRVPLDPYDDQPFRYRVSPGNEVLPTGRTVIDRSTNSLVKDEAVTLAAGQPVLWSVGPNHSDEGGKPTATGPGSTSRLDDLIFIVPLPPGARPQ